MPEFKDLSYKERLYKLQLALLEERGERGDLITIYKLINQLETMLTREEEIRGMRRHKMTHKKSWES